ncbi:hypothetical protein H0H92_004539 [Tricholoma furcatifolium]|nr:hypothetical protein H0H92_004539 [Tricholoma furcatifolium]
MGCLDACGVTDIPLTHPLIIDTMRALVTAQGKTAVVAEVPVPEPVQNEIQIKVHSIALNPVDALYVADPPAPDDVGRTVGSDFAGTVEKVGGGVMQWKVGDKVTGFVQGATSVNRRPGAFAEYAVLEADLGIRIPEQTTFEKAATLPLCSLTAAQALFIRLGMHAPFPNPVAPENELAGESPAILIYSAATSVGHFAIELAKIARTPSGKPYRIFSTASKKHHKELLGKGVEAVFDYHSPDWPVEVYRASGGIAGALDCISEDDSTAKVSQTFLESGGRIAVLRSTAWFRHGFKDKVSAIYSAVWSGLGHEILYNGGKIPANPPWRAFTVEFYKWLSANSSQLPIQHIQPRLMPGGLYNIVKHAFPLLGYGKLIDRDHRDSGGFLRPISGEKLVYHVDSKPE